MSQTVTDLHGLVERVGRLRGAATGVRRGLVGIAGPPGAGKSTIARQLADRFEPALAIVPMDGFHLPNEQLDELGRRHRKGAPDTFDATAFVGLLRSLRAEPDRVVRAPSFDRVLDEPVPDAVTVSASDRVVVVEGNYLLLTRPPWNAVRPLLDLAVYVELADDERRRRLVDRHVRHGRSPTEARRFADRSDEANAVLIATTRHRADLIVVAGEPGGEPRRDVPRGV